MDTDKRRVGILGHFGYGREFYDGQTVKTKKVKRTLEKIAGDDQVWSVDSHNWRKRGASILANCLAMSLRCRDIFILPAHHGLTVFIPMFAVLKKVTHCKIHYVVVGGWLPGLLQKKKWLLFFIRRIDFIYVETFGMIEELSGLVSPYRLVYLPNYKEFTAAPSHDFVFEKELKLCMFSRVMYEKGVEDAIWAVTKVNQSNPKYRCRLDIYGPVDVGYQERFEKILQKAPDFIQYKGSVESDRSGTVLNGYHLLLFPTRFYTEGIPGTIIDAYAAGIPVLASGWKFAEEAVEDQRTGYIYPYGDTEALQNKLLQISGDPFMLNPLRNHCTKFSKRFHEGNIMDIIKNNLR